MEEKINENTVAAVLEAPAHKFLKTEALKGRQSTQIVCQIKADMATGGWRGPPIDVVLIGTDKYIVNGHHRTVAARSTGTQVRYRVVQPSKYGYASADEVIAANAEAGPNRIRLD